MGCIDVFLEKRRGDSGVKQVILYLFSGSNEVPVGGLLWLGSICW